MRATSHAAPHGLVISTARLRLISNTAVKSSVSNFWGLFETNMQLSKWHVARCSTGVI